ncbi:ArsR family transcriptional regulator [Candidatus Micrarchaeota archaeon]|nr:ArsR family transcriptional regulator [Candidatus Micrarchaeota archaeon]
MEEIIKEKRDEKTMKIDIRKYFGEDEIYVKHPTQKRGISISELRKRRPNIPIENICGFHISRYGKPILLPLIFEIHKEWFYVSELLRTDGHISKNFDRVKLTSITNLLKEKVISLFSNYGISYIRNKEYDRIEIFNRTLALIMSKVFGIQAGNKTFTCYMPEWMKNANLGLLAYALRGAFDGDGCVQLTKRKDNATSGHTRRIRLYGASTKYLDDLRYCLLRFGINSRIFKDPRENKTYFLQISRRDDIVRFSNSIGFLHPKRKKLLAEVVASYKNYYFLADFENVVIKILKEKESLTVSQLSALVKRTPSTVSEQITKLEKQRKVKTKMVGVRRFIYLP